MYDMDIQDAVGEACIGLVTAVDKYDPDNNGVFGSYAAMWILQNISRRQPTRRELVYYPVHKKELYFSAYPVLKSCGYIDEPEMYNLDDVRELVLESSSITEEQFDDVITATIPFESFDELYLAEDDDDLDVPTELISSNEVEDKVVYLMLRSQIVSALRSLKEREREVLILRYGLSGDSPKTLEEVGALYNVTRERVRQIEVKALRTLRHPSICRMLKDYID